MSIVPMSPTLSSCCVHIHVPVVVAVQMLLPLLLLLLLLLMKLLPRGARHCLTYDPTTTRIVHQLFLLLVLSILGTMFMPIMICCCFIIIMFINKTNQRNRLSNQINLNLNN